MAGVSEKLIVSNMATVVICPIDGLDLSKKEEMDKLEQKVEKKVREIVNQLKASHSKFIDPDFGPKEDDEFGAISLYGQSGKPDPAGSKYPAPETLRWERPQYADGGLGEEKKGKDGDEEGEEDDAEEEEDDDDDDVGYFKKDVEKVFCKHGRLFVDGSSSGDVIQGQLGDCWFLSALAVLGTNDLLVEQCFWKRDEFREYGLFVLRFYKDCSMIFVIIDDRLPAREKDGRLIFAYCKDPNELWVPLIEKAYAKLFGCYKALIGGYTHYGLADMTGFCPRLVVFREGFVGYSEKYSEDEIWEMLLRYSKWQCLMGCSIQPNPKEKNKVEADAGMGLHMSHAYSFLEIGEIAVDAAAPYAEKGKTRLVKLRNPWGRGEWEGAYSDTSKERETYDKQISAVFDAGVSAQEKLVQDANDGTFLMPFKEWLKYYTSLFVAVNFPKDWCGKRARGRFNGETGGNREMGTWLSNPRFKFRLEPDDRKSEEYRSVFVGIYIQDSRLSLGFDYFKDPLYATPISFDIVTDAELNTNKPDAKEREIVPFQPKGQHVKQPPYNFGTTQLEVNLKVGVDYYIVPSLWKKNQPGTFYLNVFADVKTFFLEGATTLVEAQKPMVIGKNDNSKILPMSVSQFYEKKESLRDRIVSESKRMNLSNPQLQSIFKGASEKLTLPQFKKRMLEIGFQLADFPDDDLVVLDIDNDGTISPQEFIAFFEAGQNFTNAHNMDAPPPQKPVDDLLYKAIDLSGELNVHVFNARSIREPGSWISNNNRSVEDSRTGNSKSAAADSDFILKRGLIKYSVQDAAAAREKAGIERLKALTSIAIPQPTNQSDLATILNGSTAVTPRKTEKPTIDVTHTPRALASTLNASIRGSQAHLERATMNSVISEISQTQNEAVKQAGTSAGAKLHSDPQFQRAELSRTKYLSLLRSYNKKALGETEDPQTKQHEESSILRRKTITVGKVKSRDFSKDIDAQILLNYFPNRKMEQIPPASSNLKAAPQVIPVNVDSVQLSARRGGVEEEVFHHFAAYYDELPGGDGVDLWDYLIDCVFTIVESRSKKTSPQYQTYLKMKQKKQLSSSVLSALNPESAIATTIPTPALVKGGTNAAPAKLNKGHTPTPRSQRRAPGTASVATIQSKIQQRNNLIEAKDKLQLLQQEQGTIYEEVYRRIVAIPTIDQHDLYGEKKSADSTNGQVSSSSSSSSSNSGKVSPTITANLNQIYLLFMKFDKNQNGYISKSEFQLVFKELNIDFSAEDCDIFFHRFSSTKTADNIDWQEFLSFFQLRLLLSSASEENNESAASSNDLLFSNERTSNSVKIVNLLLKIKHIFADIFDLMAEQKVTSIDHLTDKESINVAAAASVNNPLSMKTPTVVSSQAGPLTKEKTFTIPNNAIFQSLSNAQAKHNLAILKSFGLGNVAIEDVLRIHRIFNNDLVEFMKFMRNEAILEGETGSSPSLLEIVNNFDLILAKEMSLRIGCPIVRPMVHLTKSGKTSAASTPSKKQNIPLPPPPKAEPKGMKSSLETGKLLDVKPSPRATPLIAETKSATTPPPVITVGNAVIPLAFLNQTTDSAKSADGTAGTFKVWNCLNSNNKDLFISYDTLLSYFQDLLDHSHLLNPSSGHTPAATGAVTAEKKSETKSTTDALVVGTSTPATSNNQKNREYYGISSSIILGIIIDSIIYCDWNRVNAFAAPSPSSTDATAAVSVISFSGLDAYVRSSRIQIIEKKLKYLLLLERNLNSSFTYLLIHICVNIANQELIIVGHDPMNNDIYKLQCKEEILATPSSASAISNNASAKGGTGAAGSINAVAGPWKDLPVGEKIKQTILDFYFTAHTSAAKDKQPTAWNRQYVQNDTRFLQTDAFYLYNPFEMPVEDRVLSDVVSRLKLVRRPIVHNQPYQLILGESPILIKQMKELLDAHSEKLPFFYILNDLCLRFEVDYHHLESNGDKSNSSALVKSTPTTQTAKEDHLLNIRRVVFDQIRSLKTLHQFFVSLKSSLTVILSTYNSTMREVLSWDEYLLHLLNYRNCFLTVKLLPKFIKNSEYLFESPQQKEKEQEKDSKRKSLPNTPAISPRPGAVGTVVAVDEEEENDDDDEDDDANKPEIVKKNKGKYKDFYMSDIDYDGLPHPSFYQLFSFFYEQSKLTSCPIITTEVVKMGIEEVKKYVMLIVREGKRKKVPIPSTNSAAVASSGSTGATSEKEKFWFLTVYDPRNATEYQCGVKEGCQLHSQLYYHKYLNNAEIMKDVKANLFNVEKINEYLHSAAEGNMLVLGPAITPRLQFQLYNYKDTKCQELIGECQISISSVLSNSGVGEKLWITLIYKFEKSDAAGDSSQLTDRKKIVTLPAGEIEIELSFRRSLEMESDELLTKKSSSALSIKTTSPLPSVRPDQQIPRAKDLSRDQERIAELTQQNEKLLGELNRLRSTPRSDVPARVAASTDASRELANVPLVSKQKYDELEKQKNELQALYDALKEELRVQKQKAEALKVPNKVAAPAVERSVDESKYLELVQENKSLKEQNESLKLQLQLQQKSKPDPPPLTLDSANDFLIVSNSNGPMISTPQKEGSVELSSSLSLLPTFSVNVPQVIQQILTFLYKKCEKKSLLKANNGNLPAAAAAAPGGGGLRSSKDFGSMTASQILGSFHTLLKAVVNTEGFVSYKQIQDSLLEFQVFVENEIMIKIVHEILGNFNNLNQSLNKKYPHSIPLTDFISYLTSELNQLLKQSGLGSSASRSKLRSSLDLTNAGGNNKPPLASNDDVNLRGSFEKEESKSQHTVRPSSAAAAMLSASAPVGGSGDEGNPSQLKNRKGSRLSQTLKSKSSNQIDADDKEPEKHATEKETEKLPPRRYEEVEHSPKRGSNPVDWSKVPLPEQWERRFHQPKNRFLYIDHENKKTQWHHPKDSSHANTNTNANANSYADSNANANAEKKEEPQRVYQPASASARESEKKK